MCRCRGDQPVAPTGVVPGLLLVSLLHGTSGSLDELLLILVATLLAVVVLRLIGRGPPQPPRRGRGR